MRTPPLLADFIHARACELICEKMLTLPLFTSAPHQFTEKVAVKMRSYGQKETRKSLRCRDFRVLKIHSHSIVAGGLLVMS